MLGLNPYAPLKKLLVDPSLPAWLPKLQINNLRVGDVNVTIRLFRLDDGRSDYKVIEIRATVHVVRQPSP